jgi:hypothetical protein
LFEDGLRAVSNSRECRCETRPAISGPHGARRERGDRSGASQIFQKPAARHRRQSFV